MIDQRTKFGHPLAHASERPSVLDAEWDAQMEREAARILDGEGVINWWRVIGWSLAIGFSLAVWYQVLSFFDWW